MTDQERLEMYREAEKAILQNQSYTVDGEVFSKANLRDVQRMIGNLENRIAATKRGGTIRTTQVVF